jgi:replicative DNA helicase
MCPSHLEAIEVMAVAAPNASAVGTYAKQVMDLSRRRRVAEAGRLLVEAANGDDVELREQAEVLLSEHVGSGMKRTYSTDDLATKFYDRLERGRLRSWSLPSSRLTELVGGLRPGEVTLIGGWTSHGKSVYLDNILEHVSQHATVHLFINEMTADERTDRMIAKKTGIQAVRVANKEAMSKDELNRVVQAIPSLPFGVTEASGWSAQDFRREIRRRDYDVVGIDILHLVEYREERDLAEISRTLNIAAKESVDQILSAKSFEALQSRKQEIATTLFGGQEEAPAEEHATEDEAN